MGLIKEKMKTYSALIDKKMSKQYDYNSCKSIYKDYYDILLDIIEPMFISNFKGDPDAYKTYYINLMLDKPYDFDEFIKNYFYIDTHKKILNIFTI